MTGIQKRLQHVPLLIFVCNKHTYTFLECREHLVHYWGVDAVVNIFRASCLVKVLSRVVNSRVCHWCQFKCKSWHSHWQSAEFSMQLNCLNNFNLQTPYCSRVRAKERLKERDETWAMIMVMMKDLFRPLVSHSEFFSLSYPFSIITWHRCGISLMSSSWNSLAL